jgi:hypothetical protein
VARAWFLDGLLDSHKIKLRRSGTTFSLVLQETWGLCSTASFLPWGGEKGGIYLV